MTANTTRQNIRRSAQPVWLVRTVWRSPRRSARAFSLAELMVALGILGIGLLMVAAAFPVAIDQVRQGVELQTSRLVFDEAVTMLKTRVTPVQLATFMNIDNRYGAYEKWYQLSPGKDELNPAMTDDPAICQNPIFVLSFDEVPTDDSSKAPQPITLSTDSSGSGDPFQPYAGWPLDIENINCVYSSDDTYGWVVAAQAVNATTYKFWVFVLRDPTGMKIMDGATERIKYQLLTRSLNTTDRISGDNPLANTVGTKQLTLGELMRTEDSPSPTRHMFFLTDQGMAQQIRKIPMTPDNENSDGKDRRWTCMSNRTDWKTDSSPTWNEVLCNPDNIIRRIAYIGENPDVGVTIPSTRNDPTVAVYETVIDYSAVQP